MKLMGNLIAWIEHHGAGHFVGAFVGEGAMPDPTRNYPGRAPAVKIFASSDEARQWVEHQAAALDLPVKWMPETQRKSFV